MNQEPRSMEAADSAEKIFQVEVTYHRRFNLVIAIVFLPVALFFAGLHRWYGYHWEALFFLLMSINIAAGIVLSLTAKTLAVRIRIKRISYSISFALLGVILINGLLNVSVLGTLPWMFFYPLITILIYRKQRGLLWAGLFIGAVLAAVWTSSDPVWDAPVSGFAKINITAALISIVAMAYLAERNRMRVQNELVASQEAYRRSGERLGESNIKLQDEIRRRTQSEEALALSEQRYRDLFEKSPVPLSEGDWSSVKKMISQLPPEAFDDLEHYFHRHPDLSAECWSVIGFKAANQALLALFEVKDMPALRAHLGQLMLQDLPDQLAQRILSLHAGTNFHVEKQTRSASGRTIHIVISSAIPHGYEDNWDRVFTSFQDVTDKVEMARKRQRMDVQLHQARRLQALSTLAGGIAHQFNNALGIILGRLDLMAMTPEVIPDSDWTTSMREPVDRLLRLTEQLLAYARGGKYQPHPFSANDLVRRILAEKEQRPEPLVRITHHLDDDLLTSRGDLTQIRMVIEAVLANAIESVSHDGKIRISTANYYQDVAPFDDDSALPSGDYALICIEDNGEGMDEATQRRIFEPFFTTKVFGRGLGMSAAYGIVQNHGGMITVQSTPHQGTRVFIYLPGAGDPKQL